MNMYAVLVALYGYMNPSISDWLAIGDATRRERTQRSRRQIHGQ